MMDQNLLKNLGWSPDLISEVSRISSQLEGSSPLLPEMNLVNDVESYPATTVYLRDCPALHETSVGIIAPHVDANYR